MSYLELRALKLAENQKRLQDLGFSYDSAPGAGETKSSGEKENTLDDKKRKKLDGNSTSATRRSTRGNLASDQLLVRFAKRDDNPLPPLHDFLGKPDEITLLPSHSEDIASHYAFSESGKLEIESQSEISADSSGLDCREHAKWLRLLKSGKLEFPVRVHIYDAACESWNAAEIEMLEKPEVFLSLEDTDEYRRDIESLLTDENVLKVVPKRVEIQANDGVVIAPPTAAIVSPEVLENLKKVVPKRGWSQAQYKAYQLREKNPNAYYYRFNAPGEENRNGPWTDEEHALFMSLIKNGVDYRWGVFSMQIPGRVGYQCSNYYRKLIQDERIYDPNYKITATGLVFRKPPEGSEWRPKIIHEEKIHHDGDESRKGTSSIKEEDCNSIPSKKDNNEKQQQSPKRAKKKSKMENPICYICHKDENDDKVLLCDTCDAAQHTYCEQPVPLETIPHGDWFCMDCRGKTN